MEEIKNSSEYRSKALQSISDELKIMADFWQSPLYVRKQRTVYLEQFNKEPNQKYQRRLDNSVFDNKVRETIETMAGTVFKSDPSPTDAPERIRDFFTDIDLCGNNLHSFLLTSFEKFLRDGDGFFLADASPAPILKEGEKPTKSDRENDRPWLTFYERAQILNQFEEIINGRVVLTQVTIEEKTLESDGLFGEQEVIRHKILRPGSFEIKKKVKNETTQKLEFVTESEGVTGLDEIPLVPIADWANIPPFIALALLNKQHYNQTSDFDNACHMVCNPKQVVNYDSQQDKEAAKDTQTVSPGIAIKTWGEHAKIYYAEVTGAGLEIAKARYQDVDAQMAKIGVGMLAPSAVAPRSATEVMDTAGQRQSKLSKYTRDYGNAVEKALYYLAQLENLIRIDSVNLDEAAKTSLKLKIDYDRLVFSVEQLNFFNLLVDGKKLSHETFLEWLPQVTDMPKGFSPELEIERLKKEENLRPKEMAVKV